MQVGQRAPSAPLGEFVKFGFQQGNGYGLVGT